MTASDFAKLALVAGFATAWPPSPLPAQTPAAQTVDAAPLLDGIEKRYNSAQSLQLDFSETFTARGRKRVGTGTLVLRKPGKMRWQYADGNLFISDGKFIYSYFPQEQRAEKMKFSEADDMRAPLAFLLGKLDFRRDFSEFRASNGPGGARIVATPKSGRSPYSEVEFVAAPDFTIRRLVVRNHDNSLLEFQLENEKRNPPVPEAQFRFAPPAGTELVDASR